MAVSDKCIRVRILFTWWYENHFSKRQKIVWKLCQTNGLEFHSGELWKEFGESQILDPQLCNTGGAFPVGDITIFLREEKRIHQISKPKSFPDLSLRIFSQKLCFQTWTKWQERSRTPWLLNVIIAWIIRSGTMGSWWPKRAYFPWQALSSRIEYCFAMFNVAKQFRILGQTVGLNKRSSNPTNR